MPIRTVGEYLKRWGTTPQKPVRRAKGTPEKFNMISTVTNRGKVRFIFFHDSLNAAAFLDFIRRLIRDARGRTNYLIVDNLRVHHAAKVKRWVAERLGQIELFYPPSYSPDLNPDEYLNNDLKNGVGRRADNLYKGTLAKSALSHIRSIQKQTKRVKNYFKAEPVQYAR